ncbi:MAG: sulfoxide reductase heme-binding subunit YedZ [Gammaproteobacteria bacterium]|nr:sulfoxide reductase heme-binding subunit YedZ [Gammaproteobacteria bacterium]
MSPKGVGYLKVVIFCLSLFPAANLLQGALSNALGTNPVETLIRDTGDWALRFLLIGLALTPLRNLTGQAQLMRFRRMLGLFAFFYAFIHLSIYIGLDKYLYWDDILEDIIKRPFITIGMLAFLCLVPLAVTSTNGMIRRLGGRRWQKLHKSVYFIAIAGVIHFMMLVKKDLTEPLLYAFVLLLLLLARVPSIKRVTQRTAKA